MNQRIPSLSEGLHQTEPQIENTLSATEEMSEREKIHYEYGMQRDMSKVTYFPAKKAPGLNDLAGRLRVVVYCRVSTDGLSQATSFELQRSYYLRFVRKHIQWKLIAMYSDEGITATSTEKRIGLLQMLEDAKAGKFEISLPKWIQSHKSETALKPLEIRHFTAFATSSAALGEGRFSVLCS